MKSKKSPLIADEVGFWRLLAGVGLKWRASAAVLEDEIAQLTPRGQRTLQLRFGLEDGRCCTYETIGKEFMVTRERVRQIEAKALRKLRRLVHLALTRSVREL